MIALNQASHDTNSAKIKKYPSYISTQIIRISVNFDYFFYV